VGVKESAAEQPPEDAEETARRQARGRCWAALMERTFGFDVLACPQCGGRMRLIALMFLTFVSGVAPVARSTRRRCAPWREATRDALSLRP
jgi:hypothetical protein